MAPKHQKSPYSAFGESMAHLELRIRYAFRFTDTCTCKRYVPRKYQTKDGPSRPPAIPHLVVADIAVLVERQRALVEAPLRLQASNHLVAIALTIRLDQHLQDLLQLFALIVESSVTGMPGKPPDGSAEADLVLPAGRFSRAQPPASRPSFDRPCSPPRPAARRRCRVGRPFVEAIGGVTVEDRSAKGDAVGRISVARSVMCRPVITNSNLPLPGVPKMAML